MASRRAYRPDESHHRVARRRGMKRRRRPGSVGWILFVLIAVVAVIVFLWLRR